jgi:hypothetical protein
MIFFWELVHLEGTMKGVFREGNLVKNAFLDQGNQINNIFLFRPALPLTGTSFPIGWFYKTLKCYDVSNS